jgi:lambda family phage portal protein
MAGPVRYRIKGTSVYVKPQAATASYEGASRSSRLVKWAAPSAGPNALLSGSIDTLRARSRDAVRQMGYAEAGVETLVSNIIGTGIKPQFATLNAEFNRQLADAFLEWTDEADAEGRLDFYGLQSLAVRSMIEGGDVFSRMRVRLPQDGLSVPLQLQVLEAEYVPDDKNSGGSGANVVRCGVEFDTIGRRFAYHMHKTHPNDGPLYGAAPLSNTIAVPAGEVAHLAMVRRPGQVRGEPWLTRALVKMHDLDKYDDAQLVRQQIAALFAGFITDDEDDLPGDEEDVIGGQVSDDGELELASLEPGTMQVLPRGKNINWSSPPSPGDDYEDFVRQQMRGVATSLGILYEQLTGDYSKINDRTFRAAVNEFRRRCAMWQHHLVVYQWCRPILRRWVELAVLSGRVTLPSGINVAQVARAKWVPQGWAYIHPVQDVQSKELEVRAGFKSRRAVVSAAGDDVELVDAETVSDNVRADRDGLVFDTDPRKTTRSGANAGQDEDEPPAGDQT